MTLMFWFANALVSLIEQLAALAFFLFGRNQHRASEQPYKGTRPPQPRAIALVWAEAAVDEGAAKQISDILKWCAQEELRDFIVYDPSGRLKAHAEELRRALQCSVEVGWSRDPAAINLLCGACGEQAEGRGTAQLEEVPTTTRLGSGKTQGLLAEALGTAGAPDLGQQLLPGADPSGGGRARQAERGVNAAVSMEDLTVPSFGPAAPLRCSEELCTCGGLRGPSAPRSVAVTDRDATVREAGAPSNSCSQSVQAVRQSRLVGASASGRMVDSPDAGAARPLLAESAAGDDAVLAAAADAVTVGSSPAAFGPSAGAQKERHASKSHLGHQGQASHFANGCGGANSLRRSDALEPSVGNVRVRVLSAADAYSPVLEAARSGGRCAGCGEVLPLQGGPYREGLARMRGQLQQLAGNEVLVQPELVLVVSPALTLAGYPPFQVATSEILHIGPAAQLCRSKVDGALAKYLRTEQRFGS